jgi:hypothetical protein
MNSSGTKLLRFVFLRDVDAEDARKSWREAFDINCPVPCSLPPDSIDRFLAGVISVKAGDTCKFLFNVRALDISINGRLIGRIADPNFMRIILATFIGPRPTSAELKSGLLGEPQ